jgi:hypothetical protein
MLDSLTSLAFSVYSGKGVHALLLGSGISMSSGIPTGWDIVLDLIRRVAMVEDKVCGNDAAAWYLDNYKKQPDYSELLQMTALAPAERRQLLSGYFEPNDQEREEGKKVPTGAHRAIASLVANGYVRVIVTTNFDRLMERALEEAGVIPTVIASTDSVLGARPLAHSKCTLIKVHGDYLDTRLKNTPEEIGKYDEPMNRLLDQVFDEYGLIVCGWSADWDVALRAAIERCSNRRYTMYWSAYREVTGVAQQLCQMRDAQMIKGMDADTFFMKLSEKVAALKELDAQHPLSARMAVASLKRYLPDDKDRIRIHDLVMGESETVANALFTQLGSPGERLSLAQYESHLETLLALLAAGGYWGRAAHKKLWLRCFQQLVTPRSGPFPGLASPMDFYPAYISLYAHGIAAVAGDRTSNLANILANAKTKTINGDDVSLIYKIVMTLRGPELDSAIQQSNPSYQTHSLPTSRYLFERLREPLREWLPEGSRYEEYFCRFEYLVGLVVSELRQKKGGSFGASMGLYMTRAELPKYYDNEITKYKERWPFLRAGLFDGSLDRLKETKAGFDLSASRQAYQAGLL